MRIVIAEDSVLLRAGLTRLLTEEGEDVVAAVGDAVALVDAVDRHQPDLAIVDVRMPPTHTDDGGPDGLLVTEGFDGRVSSVACCGHAQRYGDAERPGLLRVPQTPLALQRSLRIPSFQHRLFPKRRSLWHPKLSRE